MFIALEFEVEIHKFNKKYKNVRAPIGLNYANPAFDFITLPSLPYGNYAWHAVFFNLASSVSQQSDSHNNS